jgi:mRNA interferase MazF
LSQVPGRFDDWLICMISSQLRHVLSGIDEVTRDSAADFARSGLKAASVLRISLLDVVDGAVLMGAVGEVSPDRPTRTGPTARHTDGEHVIPSLSRDPDALQVGAERTRGDAPANDAGTAPHERSRHCGFSCSTSATFFARRQSFNCFSRAMASAMRWCGST